MAREGTWHLSRNYNTSRKKYDRCAVTLRSSMRVLRCNLCPHIHKFEAYQILDCESGLNSTVVTESKRFAKD